MFHEQRDIVSKLKIDKFTIKCDLGLEKGRFTAYGCDLGYKYVEINADYRT